MTKDMHKAVKENGPYDKQLVNVRKQFISLLKKSLKNTMKSENIGGEMDESGKKVFRLPEDASFQIKNVEYELFEWLVAEADAAKNRVESAKEAALPEEVDPFNAGPANRSSSIAPAVDDENDPERMAEPLAPEDRLPADDGSEMSAEQLDIKQQKERERIETATSVLHWCANNNAENFNKKKGGECKQLLIDERAVAVDLFKKTNLEGGSFFLGLKKTFRVDVIDMEWDEAELLTVKVNLSEHAES